jgi:hypothetical protein
MGKRAKEREIRSGDKGGGEVTITGEGAGFKCGMLLEEVGGRSRENGYR